MSINFALARIFHMRPQDLEFRFSAPNRIFTIARAAHDAPLGIPLWHLIGGKHFQNFHIVKMCETKNGLSENSLISGGRNTRARARLLACKQEMLLRVGSPRSLLILCIRRLPVSIWDQTGQDRGTYRVCFRVCVCACKCVYIRVCVDRSYI